MARAAALAETRARGKAVMVLQHIVVTMEPSPRAAFASGNWLEKQRGQERQKEDEKEGGKKAAKPMA
jgi:hypothetical protein